MMKNKAVVKIMPPQGPTIASRMKDVLEMLAAGASEAQILEDFPDLQAEDIRACLQYAAAQANHAVLQAV